jgi:hypothetical protein
MATISKPELDSTLMELNAIERHLSQQLVHVRHQTEQNWQDALQADKARRAALEEQQKHLQQQVLADELARFEQELSKLRDQQASVLARAREILESHQAEWVEQLLALIVSTGEEEVA